MKRLLLTIFIVLGTIGFAQEVDQQDERIDSLATSIKRFSVGLKIGVPNIAGLSLEGVTPLLDNRVAPFIDFSGKAPMLESVLVAYLPI